MNEDKTSTFQVVDQRGVRGTIDLSVAPPAGGNEQRPVLVRFEDGSQVFADAALFVEREPRVFSFAGSFRELFEKNPGSAYGASDAGGEVVIPLVAEELKIGREQVLTGGVRVHKKVEERAETIIEPILQEKVTVERVAVNRYVDSAPPVRYEGDVMIVPLVEEVLVIEKRLVVREEIRITKSREQTERRQEVVLRSERAEIERIAPENDSQGNPSMNRTEIHDMNEVLEKNKKV